VNSGLYVVATPIGNFGDMSQRAIEVLQGVDLIAAEDTRHSQRLLQYFAIHTPAMSYHDHSDERALQRIGKCLADGGSVALVSDAGTPLISDPGLSPGALCAGCRLCGVSIARPLCRYRRAQRVRLAYRPLSVRGVPARP
jgi:16S rRNA (cytidine(1402)-2'-O)-methyltransferase